MPPENYYGRVNALSDRIAASLRASGFASFWYAIFFASILAVVVKIAPDSWVAAIVVYFAPSALWTILGAAIAFSCLAFFRRRPFRDKL